MPIRERLCVTLRTFLEQLNRIFHRRKIHVRRHGLDRGRHGRLARICRGREDAFLQLQIAFGKFILLVFEQLFELGLVLRNGLGLGRVIHGNQVRTREAHHRGACDLRQGTPVGEISVGEVRVPVKVVVDRMILVAIVLATELKA